MLHGLEARATANRFHRHQQTVTTAGQGFDVARIVGGGPQCLAQPIHGGADAVLELHYGVIRPQPLADFFAAHHFAGMLQQHRENQKGLFGETNRLGTVLAQLTGAKVEFKAFKMDRPLGGVDCHLAPRGA